MNPARKRKLMLLLLIGSVLSLVTALVLYALNQNINLFYSPSDVAEGKAATKQMIRLGGMVVKGSIVRSKDNLGVQFQLTDFKQTMYVDYHGILPDLFREGQGIVALGRLSDRHHFKAEEVLAKHDANYMPPEVKAALAKTGQRG